MRFPDLALRAAAAVLLLSAPLALAANAEQVKAEIAAGLRTTWPAIDPVAHASGAAAFDPVRRAAIEANTPAPGAAEVIEAGRRLWSRKFRDGRSLAGCFPNGGRRIAAAYPQFDSRLKRVVTLETAINQCLKTHGEALLDPMDAQGMGAVLAYVRSLAAGQRIAVKVATPEAESRFAEGRRLFVTRMGQQNYACATCHLQNAGRFLGDSALPAAPGMAANWPAIADNRPVTLQMRIRECLERMGAAPFAPGADEAAHLEYFLAYLSNGLPLTPNAWRPR